MSLEKYKGVIPAFCACYDENGEVSVDGTKALVEFLIEKGVDGLVHVSQISNQWLENPVTALQVGQEVEAKIIDINPEKLLSYIYTCLLIICALVVIITRIASWHREAKKDKENKCSIGNRIELSVHSLHYGLKWFCFHHVSRWLFFDNRQSISLF